ncbi:MAG: hypothetical protein LUD78_04795 [Clostridiales bacterium]|nr:hypothetical protein [Clostridiales bacterium]
MSKEWVDAKIFDVDKSSLAELSSVKVARDAQNHVKLAELAKQTSNLYLYKVGNVVVQFDYLHNGRTVNDMFALMVQASM